MNNERAWQMSDDICHFIIHSPAWNTTVMLRNNLFCPLALVFTLSCCVYLIPLPLQNIIKAFFTSVCSYLQSVILFLLLCISVHVLSFSLSSSLSFSSRVIFLEPPTISVLTNYWAPDINPVCFFHSPLPLSFSVPLKARLKKVTHAFRPRSLLHITWRPLDFNFSLICIYLLNNFLFYFIFLHSYNFWKGTWAYNFYFYTPTTHTLTHTSVA